MDKKNELPRFNVLLSPVAMSLISRLIRMAGQSTALNIRQNESDRLSMKKYPEIILTQNGEVIRYDITCMYHDGTMPREVLASVLVLGNPLHTDPTCRDIKVFPVSFCCNELREYRVPCLMDGDHFIDVDDDAEFIKCADLINNWLEILANGSKK